MGRGAQAELLERALGMDRVDDDGLVRAIGVQTRPVASAVLAQIDVDHLGVGEHVGSDLGVDGHRDAGVLGDGDRLDGCCAHLGERLLETRTANEIPCQG